MYAFFLHYFIHQDEEVVVPTQQLYVDHVLAVYTASDIASVTNVVRANLHLILGTYYFIYSVFQKGYASTANCTCLCVIILQKFQFFQFTSTLCVREYHAIINNGAQSRSYVNNFNICMHRRAWRGAAPLQSGLNTWH